MVSLSTILSWWSGSRVPTVEQRQETFNSVRLKSEPIDVAINDIAGLTVALGNKVDKVTGKQLSSNDFSDAEKAKLAAIDMSTKADLVGGKVPTGQLPSLVIGETFTVASQAAMLALTAQNGDVAIRSDIGNRKFLLTGGDATILAGWVEIGASGSVASVNGQSGAVVLGKGDVGLGNADNTSDANKPVSTATQTALDGKEPLREKAFQALTDAGTITWNYANGFNAKVTLGGNRTLSITNVQNGHYGTLIVKQDATGSRTLTLPAGSIVIGGGGGAISLTTAANGVDIISFAYDGTTFYWNKGPNYN